MFQIQQGHHQRGIYKGIQVQQILSEMWLYSYIELGSRFTTGLRSRIFGCKSNRRKRSTI